MDFKEHYLMQMSLQFWIQDENIHIFLRCLLVFFLMPKDPFFLNLWIPFSSPYLSQPFISLAAFLLTAQGPAVACFRYNLNF